jgi:chemotaxis protein MotB
MSTHSNAAPVIIKRKKVVAGDGHHGGAWKVAYADFVTAMMAFFLLMWLLNATTEKQRKGLADYFSPTVAISRVSGGGEGMFGGETVFAEQTLPKNGTGASNMRPTEARQARGELGEDVPTGLAQKDESVLEDVHAVLKARGGESMFSIEQQRHIVSKISDEGLVIELFDLPAAPLFQEGTDQPTLMLKSLVDVLGEVLLFVSNDVAIEGHTRAYPIVLKENPVWPLSWSRADRVRVLLGDVGLQHDRMQRVTGHADKEVATVNPTSQRNNRIEVILLRNSN